MGMRATALRVSRVMEEISKNVGVNDHKSITARALPYSHEPERLTPVWDYDAKQDVK